MRKLIEYMIEGSTKDERIYSEIMEFFADNPSPQDEEIHALADKLGIDEHKFEAYIYAILGSILGTGEAKKKKFTEEDANPEELKQGIKIEMEHTKNKAVAKRIALDHLAELPDYYTRLTKMEEE
jgi:translation elongation factor EF-Tu-like GTPase